MTSIFLTAQTQDDASADPQQPDPNYTDAPYYALPFIRPDDSCHGK